MMTARGLLPMRGFGRLSARALLALSAAVGCGACAYAGLYPQFDGGRLRIVLALTSVAFGAAVTLVGLGARQRSTALLMAMSLPIALGILSTFIPAAILTSDGETASFFGACIIGAFMGAPTGLLYGVPLGLLVALGYGDANAKTDDATDRVARLAGVWTAVVSSIALLTTLALDWNIPDALESATAIAADSAFPAILAASAVLAGIGMTGRAWTALRRRRAWVARIAAGHEPALRLRALDARDELGALPRLSGGATVVEWLPEGEAAGAQGISAYRAGAVGTAVALVDPPDVNLEAAAPSYGRCRA